MDAFWIILCGSLVAISCAILGTFLVLRNMAMIGDAISHAVLPGIVIAFMLSGETGRLPMLIGAAVFGLITTFIIELVHKKGNLQVDAAIGMTFTALFAIGVVMVSAYTGNVHIDQECVLYGELAYIPFNTWDLANGTSLGPQNVWIVGFAFVVVAVLVIFGYRGLFLTSFDPQYAAAIGISVTLWHYLLMSAVSLVTVVSFESVGAILVVAFLIVPPATAFLIAQNLRQMLALAIVFGFISAFAGYYLSVFTQSSIAGSMTVVSGICFAFVFGWNRLRIKPAAPSPQSFSSRSSSSPSMTK